MQFSSSSHQPSSSNVVKLPLEAGPQSWPVRKSISERRDEPRNLIHALILTVRTKVAQTGRPSVVAVVVVGPLARVRALDGRRVGVGAAAVGTCGNKLLRPRR